MDERDKRRVGEQIEPGDRPKAPGRLELLQRFVNTWNHEFPAGWDRLGTPTKTRAWLAAKGLIATGTEVTSTDADRCRQLREALRTLIADPRDPGEASAVIDRLAASAWMRISIAPSGEATFAPRSRGVDGAIGDLLSRMHDAQVAGTWSRVKACRRCGYVFFDRSKNRSATWCAMSICGNRTKNSAYQRRRRLAAGPGPRAVR